MIRSVTLIIECARTPSFLSADGLGGQIGTINHLLSANLQATSESPRGPVGLCCAVSLPSASRRPAFVSSQMALYQLLTRPPARRPSQRSSVLGVKSLGLKLSGNFFFYNSMLSVESTKLKSFLTFFLKNSMKRQNFHSSSVLTFPCFNRVYTFSPMKSIHSSCF